MIGVELTIAGKQIVASTMEKGLLMNCTHDTVLRFLPPYIITEQHVDEAVGILEAAFKEI
jgi:acetylornithine/succinyldiaminopimelate/putrescine aminotransferase